MYGFYDECRRRYSVRLWKLFSECFNCLPVAAIIDDKILCMHGGLSPDLHSVDQLRKIVRPTEIPDTGINLTMIHIDFVHKFLYKIQSPQLFPLNFNSIGLLCDILWSDPDKDVIGWGSNERGVSVTFSNTIVETFVKKHDIDLICRAHQVIYF